MLVRVSDWVSANFALGSGPTEATVRRWIRNGTLAGRIIGSAYYVESDAAKGTGNALADKVLNQMRKTG